MTSHSDHLPSVKPAILRTNPYPEALPSVKPAILLTVPRTCRDTDFSVQKSVSDDSLPAISAKPARDTCFFSSKGVSRDRHRTSRPLQTQNPSKVYPKTIILHLFADTSAVSKPTNVQGAGEISVCKTFHQGRLCKFSQTSYRSNI